MGPMKGAWNSKEKCAERGLEVKWGTHWCPAVDMECTEDVFGCLRHDRNRARARGAVTTTTTSGRARRARPATWVCRPSAPRSTTQECQRFAQGPHDHHHGTTRSLPRRRGIKAARRFVSFPPRLRTPFLSGARSRLVPRAALTSWAAGAASFPPRGFPNYIQSLVAACPSVSIL